MKLYYFSIPDNTDNDKNIIFTLDTDSASFIIEGIWDDDSISDTYNHWIFNIHRILDDDEAEERSIVLNPGCVYFQYDDIYSVVVSSDKESITFDDLSDVQLVFCMRQEEDEQS